MSKTYIKIKKMKIFSKIIKWAKARHEWGQWEDVKVAYSKRGGELKIIQERRCKKTGKVQLRSISSG